MNKQYSLPPGVIYLPKDRGRSYALGRMRSIFKADCEETKDAYSISEWWLEPHQTGPGAHSHDANDYIFYVIEGTFMFLAGSEWIEASEGAFLRIPTGVMHDFENRSDKRAGLLNFYIPGGFEKEMPAIVQWFEEHGKE